MKEILQKWLEDTLGVIVNLDSITQVLKDGMVFIRILKRYNAANIHAIKNVFPSDDDVVCKHNLTQLKIWFAILDIEFTEEIINQIIKGNSHVCTNLLYKLYVTFEQKSTFPFITKQKERSIRNKNDKFTVTKPSLSNVTEKYKKKQNCYAEKFLKHKPLIDWYENKYGKKEKNRICHKSLNDEMSIDNIRSSQLYLNKSLETKKMSRQSEDVYYVREELKRYGTIDSGAKSEDFSEYCYKKVTGKFLNSDPSDSYFEVCKQKSSLPPISPNEYRLPQNVKEYMRKLNSTVGFSCKHHSKTFCTLPIKKVWESIVDREKVDLKSMTVWRLLKQSSYEKELAAKLFSIRKQHNIQKLGYIDLEKHIMKSKVVSLKVSGETPVDVSKSFSEDEEEDSNDSSVSYLNSCSQRYMYDSFNKYYRNEKKRTVELHRRLYAEKLKLQFDRHYAICLHALDDMIELAIRKSEFKSKYTLDVPSFMWSDWKCLLHHNQPINNFVEDLDVILYPDLSNMEVVSEVVRQDMLNENNLDMYIKVKNDWELYVSIENEKNYDTEIPVAFTFDHESQIPLGYVVNRALEKKYPLPSQIKPANIPKFPIMAVVNGIDNVDAIQHLRTILQKADILVVDVNTAVNFCLQSYKDTHNVNNIGNYNDVRYEGSSLTLKSIDISEKVTTSNAFKEQLTQTGSSLFELEDNYLDATSDLGRNIFNMMVFGNELPFNMLVDAIVQFIKHKEHDIKGWLLVNTPSTMYQASVLEYILTGKKFPYHMEDDLNTSSDSECKIISQTGGEMVLDIGYNNEVRSSRIVPNPNIINNDDVFKTYLTMYITMIKGHNIIHSNNIDGNVECGNERSDSTMLLEQPEKEGIPTLHNFYHDQGVGYDFIYEQFDSNSLKQLACVILFNYLEDEKVLKITDFFSEELLRELEPSVIVTWYNPSHSFTNNSSLFRPIKSQSITVNDSSFKMFGNEPEIKWQFSDYAKYPLPDNVLRTLASFWEATENVYLNSLKEAFFVKRNNDYMTLPYMLHLKEQFTMLFKKEDGRQEIVTEFLTAYNSISQVLRSNSEMKNELHMRVAELKQRLTHLCLKKCEELQEMRLVLINQNWAYQAIALYTNCFITFIQIELNRSVRTLEFLQDYYPAMLGIYNSESLPDVKISKIDVYSGEEVVEEILNNIGADSKEDDKEFSRIQYFKKRISINLNTDEIDDDLYKSVIDRILNYVELKDNIPPLYEVFCNKANACFEDILKVISQIDHVIEKNESTAFKKLKDQFNTKQSAPKDVMKSQKKDKRDNIVQSPNDVIDQATDSNENDNYENKETLLKNMFEEWKFAIKSELYRLSFRIELLKRKLQLEYNFIETLIGSKFAEFNEIINNRYLKEKICIYKLCNIFQLAIEEKTCINADFIFKHDHFYVVKHPTEKRQPTIKLPVSLEEFMQQEYFTINQLQVIQERLRMLAPSGIITREAFVRFIQSIISTSSNHNNIKLVPVLWNKLQHDDLELLFQKIFGKYSIIEWRDFLIYCLELPFPLTEDIIDAKLQFSKYELEERELVSYEDFMKTTLWFQRELPENPSYALRNVLSKEYLFSLFATSDNVLNYTTFLLAFCRDVDPKVGFGKTLSLLMGKCVIVHEEDLYLEEMMSDHINTEIKIVNGLLDNIINDVVCNSLLGERDTLTDYVDRSILDKQDTSSLFEFNITNNNNEDVTTVLSETMYYQFFRRLSTLQWISKVPGTLITTVLCVTYYPLFKPEQFYLYPDICHEIYQFMLKSNEKDLFVPEFVNNSWVDEMFDQVSKFTAYSLITVVKELINKHKT